MKITIKTSEMVKALFRVQGIAEKKSTMPILAHVLLEALPNNTLTVSATDHEVGLSGSYDAEVLQAGAIAVNARQLYDIVKSLASERVEIEQQDNHWVEIRAGSSRFRLVGMASEEFPTLPAHEDISTFAIPAEKLIRMIDRTIFCVSNDDNRHNLSGIYCETPEAKMLRMVATDGHRLALVNQGFDVEIPIKKGLIVPRKGFQELKRVLNDSSEDITQVELGFSDTSSIFKAGRVVLFTRLVEGQFPNYNQVIPQGADKLIHLSRATVSEALKRVSLLSQGRAWGVKLVFTEGQLELIAEDPELGDAHEILAVDYGFEPLTMGFNARYLLDVLGLIQEQGFVLEVTDDLCPAIIKPIEDSNFLAVVMPMRV